MSQPAATSDISLAELDRLIRILGMLGSGFDGEVLAAAQAAVKWVADKQTSWDALLTPEPLPSPVVGVAAPQDPDRLAEAHEADRAQAFKNGYQAGMADMARQLRAQAAQVASRGATGPAAGQGRAYSGFTVSPGAGQGAGTQGPVAASQTAAKAYPAGSWQAVAQALLERHAQGIPGVLRSREEAFVADILQRGFPALTGPQEQWLRDIAGRSGMNW